MAMDWHSESEIEELLAALKAVAKETPPPLSMLDGICAGAVVCPEVILPLEWLDLIWEPDGLPAEAARDDVDRMVLLILAHYNRAVSMLTVPGVYAPVVDRDTRTGEVRWDLWMIGFLAAMRLRPQAWDAIELGDNDWARAALAEIIEMGRVVLDRLEDGTPRFPRKFRRAHEQIADLVEELYLFGKTEMTDLPEGFQFTLPAPANLLPPPDGRPKIGRNELCPCGSGKKYKKCCGAAGAGRSEP